VFLPDIAEVSMLDQFANEIAELLIDNSSSHLSANVIGCR
jgi:hypothetical protein